MDLSPAGLSQKAENGGADALMVGLDALRALSSGAADQVQDSQHRDRLPQELFADSRNSLEDVGTKRGAGHRRRLQNKARNFIEPGHNASEDVALGRASREVPSMRPVQRSQLDGERVSRRASCKSRGGRRFIALHALQERRGKRLTLLQ